MNTEQELKSIEQYLEISYCGARMMDDPEMMLRISRALFALKADVNDDIFLDSAIEKDMEREI